MKKYFLLAIVLLFSTHISVAQQTDICVIMKKEVGDYRHKFIVPARVLDKDMIFGIYQGVPQGIDTLGFFAIDMQIKQSIYQRFLRNEIDTVTYKRLSKIYLIDENKLLNKYIEQQIVVFSGVKNGIKTVICDSNNNKDFSDDFVFKYNINEMKINGNFKNDSILNLKYKYFYKNNLFDRNTFVKITPFDRSYTYEDSVSKLLAVYVIVSERKKGNVEILGKNYTITLPFTFNRGGDYTKANVVFSDSADKKDFLITPPVKVGDVFVLNKNQKVSVYYVSEFGDTLKIKVWDNNKPEIGFREGDRTVLDNFRTIKSNTFDIYNQSQKYILLDFWGTWCAPCVAGLPKLKEFHQKYKDKIELVSIAHDKDIEKVKKFIEEKEMNWVHKFENSAEKNPEKLVEKLNVECFPTFILLDKSGKILSRGCGEKQLKEIEKILN